MLWPEVTGCVEWRRMRNVPDMCKKSKGCGFEKRYSRNVLLIDEVRRQLVPHVSPGILEARRKCVYFGLICLLKVLV